MHIEYTPETVAHFWSKVDKTGACWLWRGSVSRQGYGVIQLNKRQHRAHRIAYILTHGPIAEGLFVCHRCDVRNCIRPDHLFLGTASDNTRDMLAKGRARTGPRPPEHCVRGERQGNARLTENEVRAIRRLYQSGRVTQGDLAEAFGVGRPAICSIVTDRNWRHVSP